MEKVINLGAIKTNHAEMKEKRAAKKAERQAKREANKDEKKLGKILKLVGSYGAAVGAGAAATLVVIQAMDGSNAPIEVEPVVVPPVEDAVVPEVTIEVEGA